MFKEDIQRTIGKFLKENGHKEVYLAKHCIYYIKRYSEKLAFYIRCSDSRCYDGAVCVELFFSGIQAPDDRVVKFNVGIHIDILKIYQNITDEIMGAAGRKVIAIEQSITNAEKFILNEIQEPFFPAKLNEIYNEEILIYNTLNEDSSIREEFSALKEKMIKELKRRRHVQAAELSDTFIDNLPQDYFACKNITLDIERIKDVLSDQLMGQCMLDI